jgi:hypothetical protein
VVDLLSPKLLLDMTCENLDRERVQLTGLDGAGCAIIGARCRLLGLVESRLLRVGGDLLLGLVAESLASAEELIKKLLEDEVKAVLTQDQTC